MYSLMNTILEKLIQKAVPMKHPCGYGPLPFTMTLALLHQAWPNVDGSPVGQQSRSHNCDDIYEDDINNECLGTWN